MNTCNTVDLTMMSYPQHAWADNIHTAMRVPVSLCVYYKLQNLQHKKMTGIKYYVTE